MRIQKRDPQGGVSSAFGEKPDKENRCREEQECERDRVGRAMSDKFADALPRTLCLCGNAWAYKAHRSSLRNPERVMPPMRHTAAAPEVPAQHDLSGAYANHIASLELRSALNTPLNRSPILGQELGRSHPVDAAADIRHGNAVRLASAPRKVPGGAGAVCRVIAEHFAFVSDLHKHGLPQMKRALALASSAHTASIPIKLLVRTAHAATPCKVREL